MGKTSSKNTILAPQTAIMGDVELASRFRPKLHDVSVETFAKMAGKTHGIPKIVFRFTI